MELATGETLGARLQRQGHLAAAEVERIPRALLDGLEKVHAASFIHRDIKPDNILLDDEGQPTLIDFGAARAAVAGRTAALTGIFTPGYAAVEQFADGRQGPFTDIYALSATLHQSIMGEKPPSAIDRVLEDKYVPLAKRRPAGFAPALLAGIDRGMAVRPEARPQTIAAWRAALFPGEVRDELIAAPAPEKPMRWRVAAIAGLAAVLVAGAATGALFLFAPQKAPVTDADRQQAERSAAAAATATAEKRQTEEEAQRQAAAATAAAEKRRAEEATQRQAAAAAVTTEKRRVEEEAQREAAAEQARHPQAETDARQQAAAEEAQRKAAEAALHLGPVDRQRIQVALTAQGFDTRGTDGVLGPRSREMVAAWQTARSLPASGFLDAAQRQRLIGDSAAALAKFDAEQKKVADEEARRREQARPDATTAAAGPSRRGPRCSPVGVRGALEPRAVEVHSERASEILRRDGGGQPLLLWLHLRKQDRRLQRCSAAWA